MTKLNTMGRANAEIVANAIKAALKTVGEQYGVAIDMGTYRYNSDMVRAKIEATIIGAGAGKAEENAQAVYERNAKFFGLADVPFGKIIRIGRDEFKVVGINTTARKNNVKIERVKDGKAYRTSVAQVAGTSITFEPATGNAGVKYPGMTDLALRVNAVEDKDFSAKYKKQDKIMDEANEAAAKSGSLTGRTVQYRVADGYAVYEIAWVNGNKAYLRHIDYLDGYLNVTLEQMAKAVRDPMDPKGVLFGVKLSQIQDEISREDAMRKFFAKKS